MPKCIQVSESAKLFLHSLLAILLWCFGVLWCLAILLLVRLAAARGDAAAAQRRLGYLNGITELEVLTGTDQLEADLIRLFQLPPRAAADAGRLAMAILHRMDYLPTWNCTHLANANLQKDMMEYCLYHKLHVPIIWTPESLNTPKT
jgi:hypothetical protein